jgi:hypothetical protein
VESGFPQTLQFIVKHPLLSKIKKKKVKQDDGFIIPYITIKVDILSHYFLNSCDAETEVIASRPSQKRPTAGIVTFDGPTTSVENWLPVVVVRH